MARRPAEIRVTHIFRDGTVSDTTDGHYVPREIAMHIHAIAEGIRMRQAREAAAELRNAK